MGIDKEKDIRDFKNDLRRLLVTPNVFSLVAVSDLLWASLLTKPNKYIKQEIKYLTDLSRILHKENASVSNHVMDTDGRKRMRAYVMGWEKPKRAIRKQKVNVLCNALCTQAMAYASTTIPFWQAHFGVHAPLLNKLLTELGDLSQRWLVLNSIKKDRTIYSSRIFLTHEEIHTYFERQLENIQILEFSGKLKMFKGRDLKFYSEQIDNYRNFGRESITEYKNVITDNGGKF